MIYNMITEIMFSNIQQNISLLIERILPETKPKIKTVRTFMGKFDPEMYKLTGDGQYRVYDGYNRELSVLLFDIICAMTGSINFDNAVHTIQVMKNYIPKAIKSKKPKANKPIPEQFQLVCNTCNNIKDVRIDFYKNRLICKKCFSKKVVSKRRMKNDDKIRVSRNAG